MKPVRLLFLGALCLIGCSSRELKRDEIFAQVGQKAETTDADIQRVVQLKPQLPNPFSLAVYFAPRASSRSDAHWAWTDAEKNQVLDALKPLQDAGIVRNVVELNRATLGGEELPDIRLGAARHGADAVLVVRGAQDSEVFLNDWALSYVALVTAFFIPGNEVRALFVATGTLWDVRNEYLYLNAEGEAESQQTRPAAFIDSAKAIGDAKAGAVKKMALALRDLSLALPKTAQVAPIPPVRRTSR